MHGILTILLAVIAVIGTGVGAAPAPTPAVAPFIQERLDEFLTEWDGRWTIGYGDSPDGATIVTLTGRPRNLPAPPDFKVSSMFERLKRLRGVPTPQFADPIVDRVADSQRTTYWQVLDGQRVDGASITITRNATADLYDIVLSQVPQIAPPPAVRTPTSAVRVVRAAYYADIAREAAEQGRGTILDVSTSYGEACAAVTVEPLESPAALVAIDGRIRRVRRVVINATMPAASGSVLIDSREYAVDATTTTETPTAVLRVLERVSFVDGKARLFDPNPMRTQNDLAVRPVTVLESSYLPFSLPGLRGPNISGVVPLDGANVILVEVEGPTRALPSVPDAPTPDFAAFRRGSLEFAGAMAYFHVDRLQRHVKDDLGFTMRSVRVDVTAGDNASRVLANYCDCPVGGNGLLGLGLKGALYVAEDATVVAHEYGHALLSMDTNGRFLTARSKITPTSEAGAINEGFGDYWALSAFFKQSTDSGFDVNCYGEWAHGSDCERNYTDKPSYRLFEDKGDNHVNGQIWSGALSEIFVKINDRAIADYVILKGHYLRAGAGPAPTMPSIAEGIVTADKAKYAGVHAQDICDIFAKHDIGPLACCATSTSCSGAPVP